MPTSKMSPEKFAKLSHKCKNNAELAEKSGYAASTIPVMKTALRRKGFDVAVYGSGRPRTYGKSKKILNLWNKGLPASKIAEKTGEPVAAVNSAIRSARVDGEDVRTGRGV